MAKKLKVKKPVPKLVRWRPRSKNANDSSQIAQKTEVYSSFRVHSDLKEDFVNIIEWCELNDGSWCSIMNSFLPAIAYCLDNCMMIDPETGRKYMRANFGDVLLREPRISNRR